MPDDDPVQDLHDDRIAADADHPAAWCWRGGPRVLLGGSSEDNLFQVGREALLPELDALRGAGGDYVRCTLSSRDEGDRWPFARRADGMYDLTRLDDAYFDALDGFLQATHERDIVAQIELFDRFDHAREPWQRNPFNPANNVNEDAHAGVESAYPRHPQAIDHPVFRAVPVIEEGNALTPYVRAFVDRVLATALPRDNVLWCIDNETHVRPTWGAYWARVIHGAAGALGVSAQVTEMWDDWDLAGEQHGHSVGGEGYTFLDASQNNHQAGATHWANLQAFRARVAASGRVRPVNCVKVYGADGGRYGDTATAIQRFWLSLIGGCAAVRFHRPPTGLGGGEVALREIARARAVCDAVELWRCESGVESVDEATFVTRRDGAVALTLRLVAGGVDVEVA